MVEAVGLSHIGSNELGLLFGGGPFGDNERQSVINTIIYVELPIVDDCARWLFIGKTREEGGQAAAQFVEPGEFIGYSWRGSRLAPVQNPSF